MNVLFIEKNLSPYNGGVERVTFRLGEYFRSKGIGSYYVFEDNDCCSIEDTYKIQLNNRSTYWTFRCKLLESIRKYSIDVIIVQQIFSDKLWFTLAEIKLRYECKVVTCFHNSPNVYLYVPKVKWSKRALLYKFTGIYPTTFIGRVKRFCDTSDYFVLLSDSFKDDFKRIYHPKYMSKLVSIPNPCTFDYNISTEDIGKKRKQVLIVSRFWEKQKNLCMALHIWSQIEKEGFSDWNLAIAGNGPDEVQIKEYAVSLGLERCQFLGAVSNPLPLYMESRIFMMTSNFEGWGMTLVEALQNGCVPIVFDTFSAVHDIIKSGDNGFIVPPKNESFYIKEMMKLMKDESLYNVMSNQAVNSASKFSLDNVGRRWLNLFEKLSKD